jgi:hypothetical protein
MSLLVNQTQVNADTSFFAAAGSGGGGTNLVVSTITMDGGSTNPFNISLPAAPLDSFTVRQGGATNPIAILTIDATNPGQAEMGIRSLSTISGNAVSRGRFEMSLAPGTDLAQLGYILDAAGSGNASTIGAIQFKPGVSPGKGTTVLTSEDGTSLTVGNGSVISGPSGVHLDVFKANAVSGGNIYMPAAGTTTPIANFSTIAGHQYELWIPNLRVQNQPAGAPAAGAWTQLTVDGTPITYVDIFDMASVSTIQNDLQKAPAYNFYASANSHTLSANGSLGNTLSTAITLDPPIVYLRDLGAPANMQLVG